ncbi:MFS transporter [Yoonia sp. 2307UL14-13]|uniref:MFS transporter n=1 Tax=Yoonia sp. 2307UL14-13 TaxID=3126506 RepID=UPI0030A23254
MAENKRTELRRLLIAQVPADFSDWLDFVAIGALLAYVWVVPTYAYAVLGVAFGLPYLLVGLFAGAIVDRMSLNRVLVLSNLGRGVFTGALFFAPNWPVLMVLIALRTGVDTFFTPAKQGAIQALTDETTRMRANGRSHAINQASKIVAPALGGGLLIIMAPGQIFLLNALVSVIAAIMVWRLHPIARPPADDEDEPGMMQSIRTGLREIGAKPILKAALIMMGAGYFAMFFYDMLIVPLTRDFGFSETILGVTLAFVGAGGVLGSLMLGETERPFLWIAAGAGIGGSLSIVLGLFEATGTSMPLLLYLSIFFVLGITSAMGLVPYRTLIQNHVPSNRIGRVTAMSEAINTSAILVAPFLGAALASVTSFGVAFMGGGLMFLMLAGRALMLRDQR